MRTYKEILHGHGRNIRRQERRESPVATGRQQKETKSCREIDRRGKRGLYAGPSNPFICRTWCYPSIVLMAIVIAEAPLLTFK